MYRALISLVVLSLVPLAAQQYPSYPQAASDSGYGDGPDIASDQQHGVARISIVQGDVNLKRGDNGPLEISHFTTGSRIEDDALR